MWLNWRHFRSTFARVRTHTRLLPPYCLAWHQFSLTVMGDWKGKSWYHEFISGLFPPSLGPCIFPIKDMYLTHTSFHLPAIPPSLLYLNCLNLSFPHSLIHQGSIWTLRTILELPPTAIHPFIPPICQSVLQTRFYLISRPLTHLLTSEMWPFSHSSHSCHPFIYPLIPA